MYEYTAMYSYIFDPNSNTHTFSENGTLDIIDQSYKTHHPVQTKLHAAYPQLIFNSKFLSLTAV